MSTQEYNLHITSNMCPVRKQYKSRLTVFIMWDAAPDISKNRHSFQHRSLYGKIRSTLNTKQWQSTHTVL